MISTSVSAKNHRFPFLAAKRTMISNHWNISNEGVFGKIAIFSEVGSEVSSKLTVQVMGNFALTPTN